MKTDINTLLRRIKLVITDVDGVLTDGSLYYGPDGECLKRFNARDGLGVRMLQEAGIQVAVLSGRDCPALQARLNDLNISIFRLGQPAKAEACKSILTEAGVTKEEALFIGDDLPDLKAFACCALSATVADAPAQVIQLTDIILKMNGGQGAFRELAEALLSAGENTLIAHGDQ